MLPTYYFFNFKFKFIYIKCEIKITSKFYLVNNFLFTQYTTENYNFSSIPEWLLIYFAIFLTGTLAVEISQIKQIDVKITMKQGSGLLGSRHLSEDSRMDLEIYNRFDDLKLVYNAEKFTKELFKN